MQYVCVSLTPKLVKRIYMPLVYGKTQHSAAADIQASLASRLQSNESSKLASILIHYGDKRFPKINLLMN